jgi:hypothetical protein
MAEDELKNARFTVKYLREDKPQANVNFDALDDFIAGQDLS